MYRSVRGLNYEDLCIHPYLDLPEGFKIPKFDTFGGVGNPMAYLRAYCDQLVGVGKNEALLMRLFSRSLSGEALEWFTSQDMKQWSNWNAMAKEFVERFAYNVEIVPDHYSLEKIKQKSIESYREYAYRWRKEAARVRPPMSEKEIIEVFVRIQEPEFYDRMLMLVGAKFAEVVKVGETIEDGLKTGKISRMSTLAGSSGFSKKKREDVSSISYTSGSKRPYSGNVEKTIPFKTYPQTPQSALPVYYSQPVYQTPPIIYQTPAYSAPYTQNTSINYQAPRPAYQPPARPRFQTPAPPPPQNPPNYRQVPPPPQNNYNPHRPNLERRPTRNFTPLLESRTKLFARLTAAGLIHPIAPKPADPNSTFYKADQTCAYHSNSVGHDTEGCVNLKHKIQDLIDQEVVVLQTAAPNVNNNPLPNHGEENVSMIEVEEEWCVVKTIVPAKPDYLEKAVASLTLNEKPKFVILTPPDVVASVPKEVITTSKFVIEAANTQGLTRSGRCYTPEELASGLNKKDKQKRLISEAEAEEFWRRMQTKEYSIVKHLQKTPAQISVWALLMSSQQYRQALLRALSETQVPVGTSSDNLAAMLSKVVEGHRISFGDEELPCEGTRHNKALHITIKCQDKIVNRVLIDDGSGLNICPLSTLKQLNFDIGKMRQSQVSVKAFDGGHRETLGAVSLIVQVGPAEFTIECQVMDINTSYNLLFGRPWIHMARAVPSTLHQLMKFVWNGHEVVIHGEKGYSNNYASIVDDVARGSDYHTLEIVKATSSNSAPQLSMPVVPKMIATVMLQEGFEPGVGLGKYLQGIIEPIMLSTKQSKFGLGYVASEDDDLEVTNKRVDRALARPIPHLYQSFPVREYISGNGLEEGIGDIFEEVDVVIDEEIEIPRIQAAEPEMSTPNWESSSLVVSRLPW